MEQEDKQRSAQRRRQDRQRNFRRVRAAGEAVDQEKETPAEADTRRNNVAMIAPEAHPADMRNDQPYPANLPRTTDRKSVV